MKWYSWTGLIVVVIALAIIAFPNGEVEQKNTAFANNNLPSVPFTTSPILSSGGVEKTESNSLDPTLENQLMEGLDGWTQNGSEVYFEDERVYISATDNTNSPIIRLISKQYSGDINLAFGFNTQEVYPVYAGYNRRNEPVQNSYTCDYDFNYTLNPKHFWCYQTQYIEPTGQNVTQLLFEHDFESGNLSEKTAYWTSQEETWSEVSGAFNKQTFFINNTDTWYVKNNFAITANQTEELKLTLQNKNFNTDPTKYWIAFWPSSLTIQQAVAQDKFYALDPWSSGYNTNLTVYWNFEQTTGVLEDVSGHLYNGTVYNDIVRDATGIIDNGFDFEATAADEYVGAGDIHSATLNGFSLSTWVKPESLGNSQIIHKYYDDSLFSWTLRHTADGSVHFAYNSGGSSIEGNTTCDLTSGTFQHLAVTYDGTTIKMFKNGVQCQNFAYGTGIPDNAEGVLIGTQYNLAAWYDGVIDEVAIWERGLTGDEVTGLYNGGSGITYTLNSPPTIVLNSPVDNYNSSTPSITFNTTVTDDKKVQNVSLLIDGVIDQTNTSNSNGTYIFTKSFTAGTYNWSILAWDNETVSTQSATRDLNITASPPTVTLQSPIDNLYTSQSSNTFIAYVEHSATIANVTFYLNGGANNTNTSGLNATNYSNTLNLADGNYTWKYGACDSNSVCFNATARNLIIDSIDPTINLYSPTNNSAVIRYDNDSLNLNWTVVDANINKCWYDYNYTNNTVACGTNTTFNYEYGITNLTFWANDTVGNTFNKFWNWYDLLTYTSESYTAVAIEGATENINISGITNGSLITSANLVYNGTSYAGTGSVSGNTFNYYYALTAPGVDAATNYSFYWSITTQEGITLNTTTQNQTVNEVIITLCNGSATPFINFTTRPVGDFDNITTATFKSTWNLAAVEGGARIINHTFEDLTGTNSSWAFCFFPVRNYYAETVIEYDSVGYAKNYYYLIDDLLTQNHANVSLYLLNDSLATLTEIEVLDEKQSPLQNVYNYIQLYDVGTDTFYTVSMSKSSFEGKDLTYLNWYDSLYKMIFYQDGEIIETLTPFKISSTPKIVTIDTAITFVYEKFNDISYSLIFNNVTNNFVLSFIKPSSVTQGCLDVYKRNQSGDFGLCDTCETSNSATLYCNVANQGNGTYIARFYATGSFSDISTLFHLIGVNNILYNEIGELEGSAMAILLAGLIVSFFLISPALGVVGMLLGMLATFALGFQPFDYSIMVGIGIVGGILLWAIKR